MATNSQDEALDFGRSRRAGEDLLQGRRFRVERELGRGGMGVVLLVDDRLRGQRVALKRVHCDTGLDIWRLKHEFRAIEGLAHPNVVSVYELGTDEQGPFLLMEAVDGVDLQQWCCASPGAPPSDSAVSGVNGDPRVASAQAYPRQSTQRASRARTTATWDDHGQGDFEPGRGCGVKPWRELPGQRLERLYQVGAQLLSALACLHDQGLVHRDLKPGNVLVQSDGTVKLLDFGLLGEAGAASIDAFAGSAAYMAPEQIEGAPVEARSDLYAFGVMAFEIVTGVLPSLQASSAETLKWHLHGEAVPAHKLAPDCPVWLSSLIAWLLQKRPQDRPSLNDLIEIWGERSGHPVARREQGAGTLLLLERGREQRALLDVLAERQAGFRFVAICGESGLGKSALLDWTRRAAYFRQLTVLRSSTRFSERVPFNALDGLVDDLLTLLEHLPEPAQDGEGLALRRRASALFPVLRPRDAPAEGLEPRQAFEALLALLSRCARVAGRIFLLCDDLQWADADAVALLARLVELRPPDITLIATVRSDTHTDAFARFWREVAPDVKLALAPLSQLALGQIVTRVASEAGREVAFEVAQAVAPSCSGRPLLARAFGRVIARADTSATELGDRPISWLIDNYAADGAEQRRLLPLLGVLDGRAALPQLGRLTGLTFGALDAALAPLVREGLLVAAESLGEQRSYDFSHDLIRREVTDRLAPGEARAAHAAVADDLAQSGAPSVRWVRHLLGAERYEQASEVAIVCAQASGTAYGLAAELYQIAIEHTRSDTVPLQAARAEALEHMGRFVEAAREWAAVVARTSGDAQVDALLQQAKAWFGTEHLDEGRRVMDLARQQQKEHASLHERIADLLAPVRFMIGARALPGPRRILRAGTSDAAQRRDVVLAAMQSFFDPVAGIRSLVRCRTLCRQQGNRVQAAEADYVLAYIAFWATSKRADHHVGESYAQSAREALGFVPGPEHGRLYALERQAVGTLCLRKGEWTQAAVHFEQAIAQLEAMGLKGSFEHVFNYVSLQSAHRFSQDLTKWERTLETIERLTDGTPDSILRYEVAFARTGLLITRGSFEEGLQLARRARDRWRTRERSYQAFVLDLFVLLPEMYLSDGVEAHQRLTQLFKTYAHFRPTSGMYRGFMLSQLAWFEAAALRRRKSRASLRKVMHWAKQAELSCPLHRHVAIRAAAYACDTMGKPEHALRYLRSAEVSALTAQHPVDVAVARYQLGLRRAGEEGVQLRRAAERLIESTGAHRALLHEDPARR